MSAERVFDQIKESLSGRPDQEMVLGVCNSLAKRFNKEVWQVRLATIVFAVLWTLPALAAYIILGFALTETEQRSRKFFTGLGVVIREGVDKIASTLRDMFSNDRSSRGY